ncbi:MAG: cbb3-type cytochrome c oxidase subunit 3 [Methylovirgula sp.]
MSTYESVTSFVATWGLVYFGVIFIIVLIYALRPSNRKKFDKAARIPLEED